MLQSLPFVLIGVFASGLVQHRLSAETLTRWLPQRRLAVILLSSVFGFVAPVCDCGVIPLARRLGAKGLPAYAATTFILAAPVVNPVVLLSTAFAFQWPTPARSPSSWQRQAIARRPRISGSRWRVCSPSPSATGAAW